jgi:hypothetical protein
MREGQKRSIGADRATSEPAYGFYNSPNDNAQWRRRAMGWGLRGSLSSLSRSMSLRAAQAARPLKPVLGGMFTQGHIMLSGCLLVPEGHGTIQPGI